MPNKLVFVFIFRRENYFKIWLHCCGILLVLLLHFYRYAIYSWYLVVQIYSLLFSLSHFLSFHFCNFLIHCQMPGGLVENLEIVSIYPVLSPPNLTPAQSNRVCNALALLQCVASHPDTRMLFLNAHIPLYLYPFLNTTSKSRPFEYLRLTSLGVIGALVKVDDTEVISFLLSTEIIPLCLRTMEMGSELSKTVATFIVQKILLDDVGLDYICTTAERFFAVGRVLGNMVAALAEQPSSRLLKHIIRCYLRLSDNPRACDALRSCLPDMLRDATFSSCLREDQTTRRWLQQLLHNVGVNRVPTLQAGAGFDHMLVN
uniref:Uncharacterized protein n=1 Tax=Gossypium raimondii TaxID=29730 RepID=A0A0D2U6S9_GOSRA|nr:hypothetical protein B456_013G250200 [Gossypium raimondii]